MKLIAASMVMGVILAGCGGGGGNEVDCTLKPGDISCPQPTTPTPAPTPDPQPPVVPDPQPPAPDSKTITGISTFLFYNNAAAKSIKFEHPTAPIYTWDDSFIENRNIVIDADNQKFMFVKSDDPDPYSYGSNAVYVYNPQIFMLITNFTLSFANGIVFGTDKLLVDQLNGKIAAIKLPTDPPYASSTKCVFAMLEDRPYEGGITNKMIDIFMENEIQYAKVSDRIAEPCPR